MMTVCTSPTPSVICCCFIMHLVILILFCIFQAFEVNDLLQGLNFPKVLNSLVALNKATESKIYVSICLAIPSTHPSIYSSISTMMLYINPSLHLVYQFIPPSIHLLIHLSSSSSSSCPFISYHKYVTVIESHCTG